MAIPTSKPLNLSTVQTEYGGSNPISMSEYRGKGNAPASGPIDLWADFNGTSAVTVVTISGVAVVASFTLGVALVGSKNGQFNNATLSPSVQTGTITNGTGFFPAGPTCGVTNWEINSLTQENGTINLRFKNADDSTIATDATHWNNVTREDQTAWPLGNVVFSENADGTGNPITVVPSDWSANQAGTLKSTSYTTQWGFSISAGSEPATSLNTDYMTTAAGAPDPFYISFYG